MHVPGSQNVGNFLYWTERQKANRLAAIGGGFNLRSHRPFTYEHKAYAVSVQHSACLDNRIPGSVEAEIARIFLTGGTAKLPLLAQAIERRARAPVEVFSPLEKIGVDSGSVDPAQLSALGPQLAVALGLSMRKDREKRA